MAILPPCVRYGLREQTFDLGPGHSIEVSRRGFTIDFENKHEETPLWNCPQQVPVVRYTRLEPRAGTDGQPRHIIELFVWREGGLANQRGRMLEWWLTEVVGSTLANAGAEVLVQEPGSIWPPRGVPETIDVRFRWNKQGEATYTITGVDKTRTGVLPPPRR